MSKLALTKKIIKVALYARVSTEEQTENFSLGSQTELLNKHSKENGYKIYSTYIDGGYSGASYERPEFQRLLADARQSRFDIVLVYRLDRFFRSNKDLLNVVDEMSSYGVDLKSITEPFDTTNYLGKFVLSLFGSIAELERNTFIERSKAGRLRRYREGYYSGTTPCKFGYNYNKETKKLEINEKEAEIVRHIFGLYLQPDSSLLKVARKVRELGYKTKQGKIFESDRIHNILKSGVYTGIWHANRFGTKNRIKSEDEWIEVKVPVIIGEVIFEKAQSLLEQRKTYSTRNTKYEYLLQGLIKCGDCGNTIAGTADKQTTVKNGKRYGPYFKLYYRCTHFSKNKFERKVKCNLKYVQGEILEKTVWQEIEKILEEPSLVREAIEGKDRFKAKDKKSTEKQLELIKGKIERFTAEEQRLIEAYRENVIDISQLKIQLDNMNKTKEVLSNRADEIDVKLHSNNSQQKISEAIDYISKIKKEISNFTFHAKRKVLKLLNTKLAVNIDGIIDICLTLPKITPRFSPCIEPAESMFLP